MIDKQGSHTLGSDIGVRDGETGQFTFLKLGGTDVTFMFWQMTDQRIFVDEFDPGTDPHNLEFSTRLVAAETLLKLALDPHNEMGLEKARDFEWDLSQLHPRE